jgi:hypothetical protein
VAREWKPKRFSPVLGNFTNRGYRYGGKGKAKIEAIGYMQTSSATNVGPDNERRQGTAIESYAKAASYTDTFATLRNLQDYPYIILPPQVRWLVEAVLLGRPLRKGSTGNCGPYE